MQSLTPKSVLTTITKYWDNRASGYSDSNQAELHSDKAHIWLNTILRLASVPVQTPLRILDVGTGPGSLAIILAQAGHEVTAVDITDAMLEKAKENAKQQRVKLDLIKSDAHQLPFADNKFDLVVSRNVIWNLKNPANAYVEWLRVLNPQGRLMVFDANWYLHLFNADYREDYLADRRNTAACGARDHYACTDTKTMEQIARQLPLSQIQRPQWDIKLLLDLGVSECLVNTQIWKEVWDQEEKINYRSTPLFVVAAQK